MRVVLYLLARLYLLRARRAMRHAVRYARRRHALLNRLYDMPGRGRPRP